jgi:DNA-directed RNA polymerase alpha subunit
MDLFKSYLNNETNCEISSSNKCCLISGEILTNNHITLDCGHMFNLNELYNEVVQQKAKVNFYSNKIKTNEIRCPYCRIITPKILPYFKYYNNKLIYGVNGPIHFSLQLYECEYKGKKGNCCGKSACITNSGILCNNHIKYTHSEEELIKNLDSKIKLNFELTIEKGRGYVPAEENKKQNAAIGTIFTDSIFTPIKNVKYAIENFRVEQKTDYEKLVFEIKTDGSINPKDALTEAAKVLIHHFMLFSDERITLEADEIAQTESYDEESLHMRQLLKTKLVDMDLSVRALNCLKAAEVDTLGDLVSFNKNDLMKFRNFGKKSLTELDELVAVKNLTFGMDLAKYKLDKE